LATRAIQNALRGKILGGIWGFHSSVQNASVYRTQ